MKRIKLTQDQFALVDNADYNWLNSYKWFALETRKKFYAARNVRLSNTKQIRITMHRQILGLKRGDKREGDHRDHNTLNNCRDNLRIGTHQQNCFNQKSPLNTSSQFKGVCWNKNHKKWMAYISINGVRKHLGFFKIEKYAAQEYNIAAKKYHKNFAFLNKIT